LFDEPLSNLDAELRRELREELARLHGRLRFTAVYVTHDQHEAFGLATRSAIMNAGVVEQRGTPAAIYDRPLTAFVAAFLGANMLDVRDLGKGVYGTCLSGAFSCHDVAAVPVAAAAYPTRLAVEPSSNGQLRVESRHFVGSHWEYNLVDDDGRVCRAQLPYDLAPIEPGERVSASAKPDDVHLFDASGRRIDGVTWSSPSPLARRLAADPGVRDSPQRDAFEVNRPEGRRRAHDIV
jgi:ABC-type Fe3+/spermidine/putrescine transport system ATPase subunit